MGMPRRAISPIISRTGDDRRSSISSQSMRARIPPRCSHGRRVRRALRHRQRLRRPVHGVGQVIDAKLCAFEPGRLAKVADDRNPVRVRLVDDGRDLGGTQARVDLEVIRLRRQRVAECTGATAGRSAAYLASAAATAAHSVIRLISSTADQTLLRKPIADGGVKSGRWTPPVEGGQDRAS